MSTPESAIIVYEIPIATRDLVALAMSETEHYVELVKDWKITSPEDATLAADQLREIVKFRKAKADERLDQTRPVDALKKGITELYEPVDTRCSTAETILRGELLRYTSAEAEKARLAQVAADALRQQEIRDAQAAADKLAEHAATLVKPSAIARAEEKVEEAVQRVQMAEVSAPMPVAAAPELKGFGVRDNWKARFVDLRKLIQAAAADPSLEMYLAFDEKRINAMIKSSKGALKIPGVEAINDKTTTVR